MKRLLILLVLIFLSSPAFAIHPDERMADPVMEARAQHLYEQLRCTVCQNQSIADSNADIAADLRHLVREELEKGRSDEEILAYIQSRYGDFVLMRPPFAPHTWALWLLPLIMLAGGGIVWLRMIREKKS